MEETQNSIKSCQLISVLWSWVPFNSSIFFSVWLIFPVQASIHSLPEYVEDTLPECHYHTNLTPREEKHLCSATPRAEPEELSPLSETSADPSLAVSFSIVQKGSGVKGVSPPTATFPCRPP